MSDFADEGRMDMTGSLAGKVAIVTGGTRGIGRVMAEALLDEGASLFVAARSSDQVASATAELDAAYPGRVAGMTADVSSYDQCEALVAKARQAFGRVDILVNNAAIGVTANAGKRFYEMDVEGLKPVIDINFIGVLNMYRAAAPGMIEQGFGRIVNISTSRPTMRRAGAYGALKAAMEMLTTVWAQELIGTGVTANVLLPGGMTDTAMVPGGGDVGARAAPFAAGKGPVGLEGTNTDFLPASIMGPPIVWLAGDDSAAQSGRRYVARDWDPDMPPAKAAERATQPPAEVPTIM